jgi:Gpi18-like mannosyltransferase
MRPFSPLRAAAAVALACWAVGTLTVLTSSRFYPFPGVFTEAFRHLPFLDVWLRWDARWYERIATQGYEFLGPEQSSVAFFPLYPLLLRAVSTTGLPALLAGILLTLACGLGAVVLFHRWARTQQPEPTARLATWVLVLWPFAWYLYGAVYSDALFLLLGVGAFLCLEQGRPGWATLLGALATATRPLAPALVLGLLVRQLERRLRAGERPRPVDFLPLLSGAGLGAYMLYLWARFGSPTAFVEAQAGWGQTPGLHNWLKIDFFTQGLWRTSFGRYALPSVILALLFLALCVPMRRRLGWGYTVYSALAMGIPLLSSRLFVGLGRYALAAFPCFLMLACVLETRPRARRAWFVASALLLGFLLARFSVGRYVA